MNFLQMMLLFLKVGITGFGGGPAVLTMVQNEVVNKKPVMSAEEFTRGIAVAQASPGPMMTNIAFFVGYRLFGFGGGTAAAISLLFPSFVLVVIIAALYVGYSGSKLAGSILMGIRPAIVALLVKLVADIIRGSIKGVFPVMLLILSVVLGFFLKANPVYLIVGGFAAGLLYYVFPGRKEAKACS
ncbi:MAG: chromate transporter [Firmicutes bacterium]|nr:chromate transporter [Bacillota bacterium]